MGKNKISVTIINKTGHPINHIQYSHQTDEGAYDVGMLTVLAENEENKIGIATYWTGFIQTGKARWTIKFSCLGKKYVCKAELLNSLSYDDARVNCVGLKLILCTSCMLIVPPVSSPSELCITAVEQLRKQQPFVGESYLYSCGRMKN